MPSRRALVIGGTGFLGPHVVQELLSRNIAVTILTRGEAKPQDGVAVTCLGRGRWDVETLSREMEAATPGLILHLAGARRAASIEAYYEANTFLAERVLSAQKAAAPTAQVVLVGSAAEYGPVGFDGLATESDVCLPSTPYGLSKHAQTLHGLARAREGQSVVIARLFNPVGPNMPPGLAFADFAHGIAAGDPLRVGNLDVERDFLAVRDAARIIVDLALNRAAAGQVVNVCSGVATSIRWGLELMIATSGRKIQVVEDPHLLRLRDVPSIRGSTLKLNELGIRPAASDISHQLHALMETHSQ